MSGTHRARAAKKKSNGTTLAAIVAGAVCVVAIGVVVFLLRPGGEPVGTTSQNAPAIDVPAAANAPATGETRQFTDPEGFSYTLGSIRAGLDAKRRAYIEYLVSNSSGRLAPFESPGQLFLPAARAGTKVCADQEGTDPGLCSPPTVSKIVGFVGDKAPSPDGVDQYMPAGASFVVRVTTRSPVDSSAEAALKLYVWDVRFTGDRIAQEIPLP